MLFNSTYPENLKRLIVRKDLGYVVVDDYESNLLDAIDKIVKKSKVPREKIKFYFRDAEVDSESLRTERHLVFYHEVEESDTDYSKRINLLQLKDIREFLEVLGKFTATCIDKKNFQIVFKEVLKKYPHIVSEWQKPHVEAFFGEKQVAELIHEAHQKGYKAKDKELQELRAALKTL